jgi:hypothetical protein
MCACASVRPMAPNSPSRHSARFDPSRPAGVGSWRGLQGAGGAGADLANYRFPRTPPMSRDCLLLSPQAKPRPPPVRQGHITARRVSHARPLAVLKRALERAQCDLSSAVLHAAFGYVFAKLCLSVHNRTSSRFSGRWGTVHSTFHVMRSQAT